MNILRFVRRAGLVAAVLAASCFIVPSAFARVHVGVGISLPGIAIGVGNCGRCGYVAAPPVYYAPAYPAPAYYYPAPTYYAPAPVYYGYSYGYYAPYYPRHYYYRGYYRRHPSHYRSGYYHHR
jgi:hypothetical protein